MNWELFCSAILQVDSKIRFAAVYSDDLTRLGGGIRKDMKSFLTDDETKTSIQESMQRWHSRMKLALMIGLPEYAIAKYGKITRITIPIGAHELLLISLEPKTNPLEIIEEIQDLVSLKEKVKLR